MDKKLRQSIHVVPITAVMDLISLKKGGYEQFVAAAVIARLDNRY